MKPKPQIKREVAIDWYRKEDGRIAIYATKDAIEDFKDFGEVRDFSISTRDYYIIEIDQRYDFGEVLEYIRSY